MSRPLALTALTLAVACTSDPDPDPEPGPDASAEVDAGTLDAIVGDAPSVDAVIDAGPIVDAASSDTGPHDTGDLSRFTALEQSLIEMRADTWMEVRTGYRSVCDDSGEWHRVSGCGGLLAFSGGLYDPADRSMLLWGGGHDDYGGNEVYAFRLGSFTWERLTRPSPGPYNQDPLADGQPVSRHTYDGLTWIADQAVLWAWGGSRATDGSGTDRVWTFDPRAATWSDVTPVDVPGSAYETSAVWDPGTGLVYLKAGEHFRTYDPRSATFAEPVDFGFPPYWPRYSGGRQRAALDSSRRQIWFVGGGLYMIYDLDRADFATDDWITTGGTLYSNAADVAGHPEQMIETGGAEIIESSDPGLDYDSRADQLVAWNGRELWALDLRSKTWSQRGLDGAPVSADRVSIYGRFRYVEALNVFVLVQSPDEVWFYKNTSGL